MVAGFAGTPFRLSARGIDPRIQALEDVQRLDHAFQQAMNVPSLAKLQL